VILMRSTSSTTDCFWSGIVSHSMNSRRANPAQFQLVEAVGVSSAVSRLLSVIADHIVGKELHAAIGVMNNKKLPRA